MSQDVKYNYTVNLAGTEDRSEYDTDSYWKVVVVFQEWYEHKGSSKSKPASVNIIDLTVVFVVISPKIPQHLFCYWRLSVV